jgi:TATA-box binding protein (TBP) (component of TFIID and TFIIIB)
MNSNIDVTVENQLVRFICPKPVDGEAVVEQLEGQRVGGMVIKSLRRPRATLVIDPQGRITVHGTHRVEAARSAAKELLLRLGLDDTGLKTELGPIIASFTFNTAVNVQSIMGNLGAGEGHYDERLDCGIIHDERHDLILYVWANGKCIVTDGRHPKMVAMAAVYWRTKLSELGYSTA